MSKQCYDHHGDRITHCLQRDSLSQITWLHAWSAYRIFKHCLKLEVRHFVCNVRVLPISLLHVHVNGAWEVQPDFEVFEVWGSDPGVLSIVMAGHFHYIKTPSSKVSGFRNNSLTIKNRRSTIKITAMLPPTQQLGTQRHRGTCAAGLGWCMAPYGSSGSDTIPGARIWGSGSWGQGAQPCCQGLPAGLGTAGTSHQPGLPAECSAALQCLPACLRARAL